MASYEPTANGTGTLDAPASRRLAAQAAAAGDAWGAVVAVVRGPLFDGLVRRLVRYEHVDADLAYDLFAQALDDLFAQVGAGRSVRDPVAWVRRTALNHADDTEADRRRHVPYAPEHDDRTGEREDGGDGVSRDLLRREALRICWSLVERIQQSTPRSVVRLILQAVTDGRPDGLPADEIAAELGMTRAAVSTARSRGLHDLVDLAAGEGHTLTLDFARRLEDAEPVVPDPSEPGATP